MLLSPKENYLRLAQGLEPQYVPVFTMMGTGYKDRTSTRICGPNLFPQAVRGPQGGIDIWGVTYVSNAETGFASLPEPNHFILKDINDWEKVVVAPAAPEIDDWAALAETTIASNGIDRSQTALVTSASLMPFQQLMGLMGFTEGLCALLEEPEKVKELLWYMTDFLLPTIDNQVKYFKPDLFYVLDDTASKYAPFFSEEVFVDIFKPIYLALTKTAREAGIPVQMHNCGKCEDFVPHMIDYGVRYWDPAQKENDRMGVIEKYNGTVNIVGGFEHIPLDGIYIEEAVRQTVRDLMDTYAPTCHYAFSGGILARDGDEKAKLAQQWVQDEAYQYGTVFYDKKLAEYATT